MNGLEAKEASCYWLLEVRMFHCMRVRVAFENLRHNHNKHTRCTESTQAPFIFCCITNYSDDDDDDGNDDDVTNRGSILALAANALLQV